MERLDDDLREYFEALVAPLETPTLRPAPAPRRWLRPVAAALVVLIGAGVLLLADGEREANDRVEVGQSGAAWQPIPAAPIHARSGHAAIWTGREMIVAGGWWTVEEGDDASGQVLSGGTTQDQDGTPTDIEQRTDRAAAAYDPGTRRWRRLADMPSIVATDATAWTGTEAMLLADSEAGAVLAAHDVERDRWRVEPLPGTPSSVRGWTLTWTGAELVVWGYPFHGPESAPVELAYDPETDRWRTIAPSPLPFREHPAAVWTGTEVIIFGGSADDAVGAQPGDGDGAAYDPASDRWRALARSPLPELRAPALAWSGTHVYVWGGETGPSNNALGGRYDPSSDTWEVIATTPFTGAGNPTLGWTGPRLVAVHGSPSYDSPPIGSGVYQVSNDTWTEVESPALACLASTVWTGNEFLRWGGSQNCSFNGDRDTGESWRPEVGG